MITESFSPVKTFVATGFPFGILMMVVFLSSYPMPIAVAAGTLAGLMFGALLTIFLKYQHQNGGTKEKDDEFFEGEAVVYSGLANHFKGVEGRGGRLTLTSSHLAFRSHGFNFQNDPLDIPLEDIRTTRTKNTLGLIPNGLLVILHDGTQHSFVVNGRKKWVESISARLS